MTYYLTKKLGFSLIELITTILLIGIIAVSVLPRFIGSSTYSAHSLRSEFISELRLIQLKALNNVDRCFRVDVSAAGFQLKHFTRGVGNTCANLVRTESLQAFEGGASIELVSPASHSFSITFDTLGRLVSPTCDGLCFNSIADDTLGIGVSSEGYIYAL